MIRSRIALSLLVLTSSACSLIDPTDAPAITFEERICSSNADCIGLEDTVTDFDGITTLSCVHISAGCNTSRNRCEVTVRLVDDEDGDGEAAIECGGNDCDDTRATVYPGAREACDGVVDDCNAPNGGAARPEEDADGDQFSPMDADCITGGTAFPKTDCDDGNPNTYPGAPEACDGEINSCETMGVRPVEDMDGDAHAAPTADCVTEANNANVFPKDDCDDDDGNTHPGAAEVCDRKFNDCSSTAVRTVEDADGDMRASFLAPCEGGPIPKDECIAADLDATTRYCAPSEMAPLIDGVAAGFLNPFTVAAVDINDDGMMDVVSGNGGGTQLRRCLGTGAGAFTCSLMNGAFPANVFNLRAANVDGDADDVVFSTTATGARGIGWFSNAGSATTIDSFAGAGSIGIDVLDVSPTGDTTPDGFTDVVAANGAGTISIYLNSGTGTFTETVVDGAVTNPLAVSAADFDADGIVDIVATTTAGVRVYLSGATFGTWANTALPAAVANPGSLAVGDLDDDGDPDFAVGNETSGDIVVFLNTAGAFTPVSIFPAGATVQQRFKGVRSLVLRDYDLDGDIDIGATSAELDTVAWWETIGSMIWTRHDIVTDFDDVSAMAVGDLDGDGDEDIVAAAPGADNVVWWRTHYVSDIDFAPQRIDRAYDGARDVALDDLDEDGDLDVVAVSNLGNDVSAWINVDGIGVVFSEIAIDLSFGAIQAVSTGGFDAGGAMDVVAISSTGIAWWRNAGDGRSWSSANAIGGAITGGQRVAVGDLDGDGDTDVVATLGGASGSVVFYANDGAGVFTATTIATIAEPRGLALGDVDGDLDLDVVVASESDERVYLLTNAGNASGFTQSNLGATLLEDAIDVVLGDVDRDTRPDVIAMGVTGGVHVYVNSASGFTAPPVVVAQGIGNFTRAALQAGDLDGDGDLDIVTSMFGANLLSWYESTARNGSEWVEHRVVALAPSSGPEGIDLGDLDGDGNLDVAATLGTSDDVLWFKSDGAAWWNP